MSKYEMFDYDRLLRRIGIEPGETWFCGKNPPQEIRYDEATATYDDMSLSYIGLNQHHPTLCLGSDINVNGLLLNHRDLNGTIWLCTGVEGWWTTPAADIQDVPNPYGDGSMLTTGRYLARTITISGCFIPSDPSLVWYNRDALIRCGSIVRGSGLLAMCGNQTPSMDILSEAYDPPKMALIQTADVPLIDTNKGNGFTQFSLSFRCVVPTKLGIEEKTEIIPLSRGNNIFERYYRAFSTDAPEDGETTEYDELTEITGTAGQRTYGWVHGVNPNTLIESEKLTEGVEDPELLSDYYDMSTAADVKTLLNRGNYFAAPILVLGPTKNIDGMLRRLILWNYTTQERMDIIKNVPAGKVLVIDTAMRRVALVDPNTDASSWKWDARSHLTLTSEWISLAPGYNSLVFDTFAAGEGYGVEVTDPRVFWRDTWIG